MEGNRLASLIAPKFYALHHRIKAHEATHYWLAGGRGSTKSSFAAMQAVLALKRDPSVNAVVLRKVAKTMRDSVYADVLRAADRLGVGFEFHGSTSPMEIVYRPTGQRIIFRGTDDAEKLKSITAPHGYFGVVWFEELDAFAGMEEVRSLTQSLLRGGDRFTALYSYNPPRSRDNWVNKQEAIPHPDRIVHRSCYTDVDPSWLGPVFLAEAEWLKGVDERAYRHEYLGEAVGTGGAVFDNVELRTITDEEIAEFDRIYNGVDWGYFPDPWVFGRMHYAAAQRTLYIFAEASGTRMSNAESSAVVRTMLGEVKNADGSIKEYARGELVMCDSAESKSIAEYRIAHGIDARPAKKGAGSVEYGMKWLASRAKIVIDPVRCPLAAEEFPAYEFVRDRAGEFVSAYPDANNHSIDLARYALSPLMARADG
jgi:PBSX family phage terminase large subunit